MCFVLFDKQFPSLSLHHLYSPFSTIFGLYLPVRGKFATVAAEYFTLLFGAEQGVYSPVNLVEKNHSK